jgi:DeoR family fructose operon transcriptional repressor
MATTRSIDAEGRREFLLTTLREDGGIRMEAAAEQLGVSIMTVRRDLDELEAVGLVRRVRGGAIPPLDAKPFSERRISNLTAKATIATKAARLIPRSGSIALDASSTAGGLSQHLDPLGSLSVATNSYDNFAALAHGRAANPILVGGELDERTGSLVGLIACQAASSMLYSRFFASASGIDPALGTSEVSLNEVQVKQAFAAHATETVMMVDSSKLDQRSVSVGFAWTSIALLITELDPMDSRLDAYRDRVELL